MQVTTLSANLRAANSVECSVRNPYWLSYKCVCVLKKLSNCEYIMGVGEDLVSFDVEKEYGGEEDEVLWPHRPEEPYGEKIDVREGGIQAKKGQTSNGLVPGFKRMDQAGHYCCITTVDRSGKMERKHQSHSNTDSAT